MSEHHDYAVKRAAVFAAIVSAAAVTVPLG